MLYIVDCRFYSGVLSWLDLKIIEKLIFIHFGIYFFCEIEDFIRVVDLFYTFGDHLKYGLGTPTSALSSSLPCYGY